MRAQNSSVAAPVPDIAAAMAEFQTGAGPVLADRSLCQIHAAQQAQIRVLWMNGNGFHGLLPPESKNDRLLHYIPGAEEIKPCLAAAPEFFGTSPETVRK